MLLKHVLAPISKRLIKYDKYVDLGGTQSKGTGTAASGTINWIIKNF